MYGLPSSTEIKKQIPKKAIFAKVNIPAAQRDKFDNDISRIDIVGNISPSTIPSIAEGERIKAFYILTVTLKNKDYDRQNLLLLTKIIPQNMIFAVKFAEETQLIAFHTGKLIASDWHDTASLKLLLSGMNLDMVWDNLIKEIGQIDIENGNSLSEQISINNEKDKIIKKIEALEKKMRTSKQPKRKLEFFEEIKLLKKQLERL